MNDNINLVLKKVENEQDIELLRNIRNECCSFMTNNSNKISKLEQKRFFEIKPENYKIFLLHEIDFGVIESAIGYGLIKDNENESIITLGLSENCRNKGYGKHLLKLLILNCSNNKPIRLEVLKTNTKALSLYNNLNFRIISDDGKIIKMELVND